MYPYNHKKGQKIQTDAKGVSVDRAFLAHYQGVPDAESDTAIANGLVLGAQASSGVTEGLSNPDMPRNIKVKASSASVSGTTYKVKVYGKNFSGEEITEEINPNGTSGNAGSLAFKEITKVDLPARANTPVKQKAKVSVTAITGGGTETLSFVSAATGAAFDVNVTFAAGDDTAAEAAAKIVAALNGNETFGTAWLASSAAAVISIECTVYAAQDNTINLTVKNGGTAGLTLGTIDPDGGAAGVAEDKIYIGIGKKIGIPYKLTADEMVILKLFNNAADSGSVTNDASDIEKNVITLNGTPNGEKMLDLYIVV